MGLDAALYNVSESDEVVEVCVTASSGNTQCPNLQPFQVTMSTAHKSAGSYCADNPFSPQFTISHCIHTDSFEDYQELNTTLAFGPCDTRHCVNISIVNDLINEPVERFSLSLTADPDLGLILDPHAGEIMIIDDDGKKVGSQPI